MGRESEIFVSKGQGEFHRFHLWDRGVSETRRKGCHLPVDIEELTRPLRYL